MWEEVERREMSSVWENVSALIIVVFSLPGSQQEYQLLGSVIRCFHSIQWLYGRKTQYPSQLCVVITTHVTVLTTITNKYLVGPFHPNMGIILPDWLANYSFVGFV